MNILMPPETYTEAAQAMRDFLAEHFPDHSDGHEECGEACRLVREFDEAKKAYDWRDESRASGELPAARRY